jgi:hypothetical protein
MKPNLKPNSKRNADADADPPDTWSRSSSVKLSPSSDMTRGWFGCSIMSVNFVALSSRPIEKAASATITALASTPVLAWWPRRDFQQQLHSPRRLGEL